MRPCMDCGELTDLGPRCDQCRPAQERSYARAPKKSFRERGYDTAWTKLSARARRIQPWCSHPGCGALEDLTTDHLPIAWERKAAGKSIRLCDVQVLCRSHNASAGTSRPSTPGGLGSDVTPRALAVEAGSRSHTPGGYL